MKARAETMGARQMPAAKVRENRRRADLKEGSRGGKGGPWCSSSDDAPAVAGSGWLGAKEKQRKGGGRGGRRARSAGERPPPPGKTDLC